MPTASLPAEVRDLPVKGRNLIPGTFGDQIGDEPTLLVFLRHFG